MERPTYVKRNFWLPTLLNTTILFTYITTNIKYKYLWDTYSYNPEDDNAIGVLNNLSILNDFQPTITYYVEPLHYDIRLILRIQEYDHNKTMGASVYEEIVPSITRNAEGKFGQEGKFRIMINILRSIHKIQLHTLNNALNNWLERFVLEQKRKNEIDGIKISKTIPIPTEYLEQFIINRTTKLIGRNGVINVPKKYLYTPEMNILDIEFFDLITPGIYTLKIRMINYISDKNKNGLYRTTYMNKDEDTVWVIAPHIQDTGARRFFPCWDEPHLKTTFTISVKHPQNFSVLSNMPMQLLEKDLIEDTFMWTYFYTTPPISTSQVSIVLFNFLHIYIHKNINFWYRKSFSQTHFLNHAQQVIKNITYHLESVFGGIKIPKVDHIAIPHFPHNSTTKLGFVFYSEGDLIYYEQLEPIMSKVEIARSITCKTAHQWFGNTLGPFWSNFWLHDGLATLFGDETVVKIFNNLQLMDLFIVQSQYEALYLDSYFDMRPPLFSRVSNIESIFSFPRYKVLIFLRMYRDLITDVAFRNGLRTYLYKLTFNSASVSEFWSILQQNQTKEYSYDFLSWLDFDHYPVVSWKRKSLLWSVLAHNFNISSYSKWWIPIRIMSNTTLSKITKVWLTPQIQYKYFKGIPVNDAVMLDIQQAGYYRVNYEPENWRRIGYYLKSGGYKQISIVNRAKLIDDACHLFMTRQLNVSIFLELTEYLSQETNFVAWYPIIKMLEDISGMIRYSQKDTNFMNFKMKMKQLLGNSLKKLGYEEFSVEDDLMKSLRREIAKWACMLGDAQCMLAAHEKLVNNIRNRKQYKLLTEWKKWTYCNSFKILNSTTYSSWLFVYMKEFLDWSEYNSTEYNKYVQYIACIEDAPTLYQIYSFFIMKDWDRRTSTVHSTKEEIKAYINAFYFIVAKAGNNDKIIQNLLLDRFLDSKGINRNILLILIINNMYSTQRFDEIMSFIKFDVEERNILTPLQISQIQSKFERRLMEIGTHSRRSWMFLN